MLPFQWLSSHKIIHRGSNQVDTFPSQLSAQLCMSRGAEFWADSTTISPKEPPGLIATPRAALLGRQDKSCFSFYWSLSMKALTQVNISVSNSIDAHFFLLLPGKTLSKHLWCSEDLQLWASTENGRDINKICTTAKALLICKSLQIYRRESTAD